MTTRDIRTHTHTPICIYIITSSNKIMCKSILRTNQINKFGELILPRNLCVSFKEEGETKDTTTTKMERKETNHEWFATIHIHTTYAQ